MLLYLNKATWAGDGAEALAEQGTFLGTFSTLLSHILVGCCTSIWDTMSQI